MVLCNKIAEGIDTRNIGESRCAEFSLFLGGENFSLSEKHTFCK
ncbi:hypothetical protein LEP1GSC145_3801 [Leptospira interrogans serovar Djasiman str. LT1649]|nr:hypothetical protein LEP1GSC145_3801 [Leptospira interrogans serovar Djasiman str. LT1649]